jgi:hypothetical protein
MAKRKAASRGSGFAQPMDDNNQGPHGPSAVRKKKSKKAKKAKKAK